MLFVGLCVGGVCGNSFVKGWVGLVVWGVFVFEVWGGGMKMLLGVWDYECML